MGDLKNKRVISCAITGSWPTREDNPNLSITPQEIADDAYEAWKAGAAIVHIHVRNEDGSPSTDYEKYKEETKEQYIVNEVQTKQSEWLTGKKSEYSNQNNSVAKPKYGFLTTLFNLLSK